MSYDAAYLLDLFTRQLVSMRRMSTSKRVKWETFDKLSYGAWAIEETIEAIHAYDNYVTVAVIRDIIRTQLSFYESYYSSNKERQMRYRYAMNTMEYLYRLTGGYVYE